METETLIEDWFKRNYKCMVNHFQRKTGKLEDAEDIVMEGVKRALMWKDSYNPKYDIDNWMYTIILNSFRDFRKQKLSSLSYEVDFYDEDEVYSVTQLEELIEYLPENYKEIGTLYIKGYRAKEIYRILDMKYRTVKEYCYRVRKLLKENANK